MTGVGGHMSREQALALMKEKSRVFHRNDGRGPTEGPGGALGVPREGAFRDDQHEHAGTEDPDDRVIRSAGRPLMPPFRADPESGTFRRSLLPAIAGMTNENCTGYFLL